DLELDPAALADGYRRLARNDPKAALERFPPLRPSRSIDATTASRMALALALGLAWDRRPEALALFEQVDPADVDDYALTWRARAALWNGDWPLLEASIAAMSPAVQDET